MKKIFIGKRKIVLYLCFILLACKNENNNDIIPLVSINIRLFENDKIKLGNAIVPNGSIIIPNVGYRSNGVILFNNGGTYKAFDATCTYEVQLGIGAIGTKIDNILAKCPVCNSSYNLLNEGYPQSQPAQYPLKEYRVTRNNGYIIVSN